MAIEYKCPICGCTEHYELIGSGTPHEEHHVESKYNKEGKVEIHNSRLESPKSLLLTKIKLSSYSEASIAEFFVNLNASVYICKKCGHIDLFNPLLVENIKKEEKELQVEIAAKEKQLIELEQADKASREELDKIVEKLKELNKKLSDENITIKQHNAYKEEAKKLGEDEPKIRHNHQVSSLSKEKLEKEIADLRQKLKDVSINPTIIETSTKFLKK